MQDSNRDPTSGFPTTRWSQVRRAASPSSPRSDDLTELLQRYLPVMRVHLTLGRRVRPELADDVLQGFVASKILEQGLLGAADPARGRFRSFLLTSLDRFLIDRLRHESARDRHLAPSAVPGDSPASPLDACDGTAPAPGQEFNLAWARQVLDDAIQRTRQRLLDDGRDDVWTVFEWRVLRPIFDGTPAPAYKQFVGRFNFRTATEACTAIVTARRAFARSLREVIGQYARDEATIDAEMLDLRQILAGSR